MAVREYCWYCHSWLSHIYTVMPEICENFVVSDLYAVKMMKDHTIIGHVPCSPLYCHFGIALYILCTLFLLCLDALWSSETVHISFLSCCCIWRQGSLPTVTLFLYSG